MSDSSSKTSSDLSASERVEAKGGNPGYDVGSSVVVGHSNFTSIQTIDLNTNQVETVLPAKDPAVATSFGVWSVPAGGPCNVLSSSPSDQRFQPISFGYDLYTGCRLR